MSLERKIRILVVAFTIGLVISGITAIPLLSEVDWLIRVIGGHRSSSFWLSQWLFTVRDGLAASPPFMYYGTDWLAFGHFAIAVAFIGPIHDPIRNIWVVQFGIIASILVIPFALILGEFRGIPVGWRLIDCSFGVAGFAALALAHKWIQDLETERNERKLLQN